MDVGRDSGYRSRGADCVRLEPAVPFGRPSRARARTGKNDAGGGVRRGLLLTAVDKRNQRLTVSPFMRENTVAVGALYE